MTTDRKAELVARGWTPLEAEEIIAFSEYRLKAEDAELVEFVSSDSPQRAVLKVTPGDLTPKQRENLEYLRGRALEATRKGVDCG